MSTVSSYFIAIACWLQPSSGSSSHSIDVVRIGLPNRAAISWAMGLSGTLIPTVLRPLNAFGRVEDAGRIKVNAPGRFSRNNWNERLSMRAYCDAWDISLHTIERFVRCVFIPLIRHMRSIALLLSALQPMA